MTGKIIKGIGGFYYILCKDQIYTLKARGKFRIRGGKPIIGDLVEFSEDNGFIETIHPRKNEFIRPAVSNMSQIGAVFAPRSPAPDLLLIDQILIQAGAAKIDIFVALNKCELTDSKTIGEFEAQYKDYGFLVCSTYEKQGISSFREKLVGQNTFLAGQSGVGKSSLVNAAFPDFDAEVGEVSEKLERGKHTTRHVELMPLPGGNGTIVDTPGFSYFDIQLDEDSIEQYYRDFEPYRQQCRFVGCSHTHEPDCAVKEQVGNAINIKRYERYLILYEQWQQRRKKQYD